MKGEELLRLQANDPSGGASNHTLPSFLFSSSSAALLQLAPFLLHLLPPPFSSLSIPLSDKYVCECVWVCSFSGCVCVYVSNM